MCNLYRMRVTTSEIGQIFDAIPDLGANYGEEIYPGYSGLVVADGQAQAMTWGFPLVLTGKQGQKLKPKPVNNARTDKLQTAFWRDSFARRRCLIPVSEWAEAEGQKGQMTRTWYSLPGGESFAVAGVWRATFEWGNAYSMVMTDGHLQMADVHDRMPVIVMRDNWAQWANGSPDDAFTLCQPWPGDLLVERSATLWAAARPKSITTLI